jgi:hypothetical protein
VAVRRSGSSAAAGPGREQRERKPVSMTADTTQQTAPTTHEGILSWVTEIAELTQPDRVHWCTGSDQEWTELTDFLVSTGTFTRLNEEKKPNSFYAASDPTDVARVEDRTYICSVEEKDAGPTNNWMDPNEMKAIMRDLYQGCMKGRTMYFVSLQGHGTSAWPGSSGIPTECSAGTHCTSSWAASSSSMRRSTCEPIRAITRIEATT